MIFLILAACSVDKNDSFSVKSPELLTWTKDLQPVVEQHCVRCHQEGEQGTGDFTDFDTVSSMAELMSNAVNSGSMPPPVADPSCHDYTDSDRLYMSDESKSILAQWILDGKEYGSEEDALEYDRSMSEIKDPDLILTISEPYAPSFTDQENPGNEYRCFALQHNQEEPFYITELHPVIDNSAIIHHMVLAKGTDAGILPGSEAPEGLDCINNNGAFVNGDYQESGMLAGWAPGGSPVRFPEGAGLLIRPDEYLVVQVHYYQSSEGGENPVDQSGYAFKTTTEMPESVVQMIPFGIYDFTIPAGEEAHTETTNFSLPLAFKLWGVFPHMHILGSGYEMSIEDECVIGADKYDFYNQVSYMYDEPISVPSDAQLNWSCTWDNSVSSPYQNNTPPVDTYYGERTNEEMCFAFMMVSF